MALAAAAAATAIGYAVEKVTKAFDNLYFQAQRSGTSVESLKAIGHAFSQTGGSAQQAQASVDSFTTKLRNNPGLRQFTKELGVDQKLGGVDKYVATLDAIKARTKDAPFIGVQYAEMLGISEENYNQFVRQGDAIKAYRKEYDDLAERLRFDSDHAAEGATAFQRSLGRLAATAGIVVEKLLTALAPALKEIVDRFQAWIEANPGALDKILTNISTAVVNVANAIGRLFTQMTGGDGDEAVKLWDEFALRAERMAKSIENIVLGLEKILKFLGLINRQEVSGAGASATWLLNKLSGGTLAPNGEGGVNDPTREPTAAHRSGVSADEQREKAPAEKPGLARRAWNAVKTAVSGGSAAAAVPAEDDATVTTHGHMWRPGSNTAAGRERVGSWLKFFQAPVEKGGMGADVETARSMVAMMQGESGASLNPTAKGDYVDPRTKTGPTAFGTAQWREDRFDALKTMAARMGTNWTDVGAQQQHLRNEFLHGRYRAAWNRIQAAPTGEAKLLTGIKEFERPKYPEKAYDFRVHYLRALRKAPDPAVAANSEIVVPPTVPPAGSATAPSASPAARRDRPPAPNMTPGGFDVNAALRPSSPAGIGPGATSTSNSTDARSITQHIHNDTKISGVERPADHAKVVESSLRNVHQMSLENAQSAIA